MKGVGMGRHRRTGRTHPGGRASAPPTASAVVWEVGDWPPPHQPSPAGSEPAVEPEGDKRRAPSSRWGDKHPAP